MQNHDIWVDFLKNLKWKARKYIIIRISAQFNKICLWAHGHTCIYVKWTNSTKSYRFFHVHVHHQKFVFHLLCNWQQTPVAMDQTVGHLIVLCRRETPKFVLKLYKKDIFQSDRTHSSMIVPDVQEPLIWIRKISAKKIAGMKPVWKGI